MLGGGPASTCTVAVDAMGGDNAPDEILRGATEAHQDGTDIILLGPRERLIERLETLGLPRFPVVDAPDTIGMDEPIKVAMRKQASSLRMGAHLLATGEAHALVSAGNSAAIMAISMLECGRQAGIDRPAFGGTLPARNGKRVFLLDIGANPNVKPSNLVQFAVMGEVFVKLAEGIAKPRIALLSNGTEDSKGTDEIKEAHEQLRRLVDMNFIGNIEGNHVFDDQADVVVCDGFAGNVLLKGVEGAGSFLFDLVREEITRDLMGRIAAAALLPAFSRIRRRVDYQEYGGAPVLGVDEVVVNCHGRSKSRAVSNAIKLAEQLARERLVERIGEALQHEEVEVGRRRRFARALHLRGDRP